MQEIEFDEFDEFDEVVAEKVDVEVEEKLKTLSATYNDLRVKRLDKEREAKEIGKEETATKNEIAELFPSLGKPRFSHSGVSVASVDNEEVVISFEKLLRTITEIKKGDITLTAKDIQEIQQYISVGKGKVENAFTKQEVNDMTVVNKLGKKLEIKAK